MAKIGASLVGAGMGLLGMIGQNARARKQHERTKELMDIQNKNQWNLNKQGADLQMDMWNKTNYGAQMQHLKDAGLNPSLMYGNSGGGGTTAGSQTGGSAGSGQAHAPMDIGASLNAGLMAAQIANIEADTELKKEGTGEKYQSGMGKWLDNVITMWKMEGDSRAVSQYKSKKYGWEGVSPTSVIGKQELLKIEENEQAIKNLRVDEKLKEAGIILSEEQTRKLYHDIIQGYIKNGLDGASSVIQGVIGKGLIKAKGGK